MVVLAVAVAGCDRTHDRAAELDSRGGTVITTDVVLVDGVRVPTSGLAPAYRQLAAKGEPTYVVVASAAGQAGPIVDVLRAVAADWPEVDILVPRGAQRSMVCEHAGFRLESAPEPVRLFVRVQSARHMIVAVSGVADREVTDVAELAAVLGREKRSARFAERETAALLFADDAPASVVVPVIGAVCGAGFRQMVLPSTAQVAP